MGQVGASPVQMGSPAVNGPPGLNGPRSIRRHPPWPCARRELRGGRGGDKGARYARVGAPGRADRLRDDPRGATPDVLETLEA